LSAAACPDTSELLVRVRAGDSRAVDLLIERLDVELLRRVRRDRRARGVRAFFPPEEIVQEVWQRVLRSDALRRFQDHGEGSLRRYLGRLVERTIIDCHRRLVRRRAFLQTQPELPAPDDDAPACPRSTEPSPTSIVRTRDLWSAVLSHLRGMERTIARLAVEHGLGPSDIARSLGVRSIIVRCKFFRLRRRLRRLFGGDDGASP
jgi:RNA polymerase sigma factor (sigma-70 family)